MFEHFRTIAKPLGLNVACVSGDLETILWEAARSGWRDGYSAESADPAIIGYSRYIGCPTATILPANWKQIARARVPLKLGRMFDWELQLDDSVSLEDADEFWRNVKPRESRRNTSRSGTGGFPARRRVAGFSRRQNFAFSFSGVDRDLSALSGTARRLGGRFNYHADAGSNVQELASALFG